MTKDVRKKASMSQVLSDIKPYITKKFMSSPHIHENDIPVICQLLLPRYKNVILQQYNGSVVKTKIRPFLNESVSD